MGINLINFKERNMQYDIYLLLAQDIIDFNTLNALPENSQGPQVTPMTYKNENNRSSVKMNFSGTANAVIPAMFMFSNVGVTDLWITSTPITLDGSGNANSIEVECWTTGAIVALANTLTNMVTSNPDVASVTNPYDAIVSGQEFNNCVDKSTIDDPDYQPWTDAMENNQAISTREVITITMV